MRTAGSYTDPDDKSWIGSVYDSTSIMVDTLIYGDALGVFAAGNNGQYETTDNNAGDHSIIRLRILEQLRMFSRSEQPRPKQLLILWQLSQVVGRRQILALSQTCVDLATRFTPLAVPAQRMKRLAKFLRNPAQVWQHQQ